MSSTDTISNATSESTTAQKNRAKVEQQATASEQSKAIADAIEQMRSATSAIYQAFGKVGGASSEVARLKLVEGKERAEEVASSAETAISKKPLMYVSAAFAAGFVASRLLK